MSEQAKGFDEWAVVELFGHQRIAGRVSELTVAGQGFIRVDVPPITASRPGKPPFTQPGFTRLFGTAAIYAINPTSEAIARHVAEQLMAVPISRFELPRLPAPADKDEGEEDEDRDHGFCSICGHSYHECMCDRPG